MKAMMLVGTMVMVGFTAGWLTSCSSEAAEVPPPVPPVSQGSFVTPMK